MALRKIFNYDNPQESKLVSRGSTPFQNSITACGALFFKVVQGRVQLLLIRYANPLRPRLDDLGGKIDPQDASLEDAIAREVCEETNGILGVSHIQLPVNRYYNRATKYMLSLVRVDESFATDTTVFGTQEHGNHQRTIDWYDYDSVRPMLAVRLQMFDLFADLDSFQEYS